MPDEEFANYLAKMKADHVTKMAALEEEAASLREPVKNLDVEIAKECFFIMNLTNVRVNIVQYEPNMMERQMKNSH